MRKPVNLSRTDAERIHDPVTTALIAFRLGRQGDEHYHVIAGHLAIAHEIASIVQRHNHLKPELQAVHDLLLDIGYRDGWAATPEEVDRIEIGCEIAKALLLATTRKTILRAINRIKGMIHAQRQTDSANLPRNP